MNTLITFHTHEAARAAFQATLIVEGRKFEQSLHIIELKSGGRIVFHNCAAMQDIQRLAGYRFQAIVPGDGELSEELRIRLLPLVRSSR